MFVAVVLFYTAVADECSPLQRCFGNRCTGFAHKTSALEDSNEQPENNGMCAPRATPVVLGIGNICDLEKDKYDGDGTTSRICDNDDIDQGTQPVFFDPLDVNGLNTGQESQATPDDPTTTCCKSYDSACICDVTKNPLYKSGTVEVAIQRKGLVFRKLIEITTHEENNKLPGPKIKYQQNYIEPPESARMRKIGYDKDRCRDEVCMPGPCVFLDMHFAGDSLLNAYSEAQLLDPKENVIDEAQKDGDHNGKDKYIETSFTAADLTESFKGLECVSWYKKRGCIPANHYWKETARGVVQDEEKDYEYSYEGAYSYDDVEATSRERLVAADFSFVDSSTYCGPMFGTRAVANGLNIPNNLDVGNLEQKFPTEQPVSTSYRHSTAQYGPSGVIVPVASGKFIPDHYFTDGAEGRSTGGSLKTEATNCQDRYVASWKLPRLCGHNRYRQCLPGGYSNRYRAGCPFYTMMDPFGFNGAFGGVYKHARGNGEDAGGLRLGVNWLYYNRNWGWQAMSCHSLKNHKFYLRTPEMFYDAFADDDGDYIRTPEAAANRLVLTHKWGIGNYSRHGFLQDPHGWLVKHDQSPNSWDSSEGTDAQFFKDENHQYYRWQHQLYDEDGHKTDGSDEKWNDMINEIGFKFYKEDFSEEGWKSSSPGQTLDPTDVYNEEVRQLANLQLTRPLVPMFIRGNQYSKTLMFMHSYEGMAHQLKGGTTIEYYHPMFRPVVFKDDGTDDTTCVAEHITGTDPQGKKGYCYISDNILADIGISSQPKFAMSIYGMVRTYNMYVWYHYHVHEKGVLNPDPPLLHFCEEEGSGRDGDHPNNYFKYLGERCEPTTVKILLLMHGWVKGNPGHRKWLNTPADVRSTMDERNIGIKIDLNGQFYDAARAHVSDQDCDMTVCDVAQTYSLTFPGHYSCISRGNTAIETRGSTLQIITQSPQDITGGIPTQKEFIKFWYNSAMVLHRQPYRREKGLGNAPEFSHGGKTFKGVRDDPSKPMFVRWMIMHKRQHSKSTDKETVSYYDSVSGHPDADIVTFFPTTRDAGYSQESSIPENNACNCDNQPIEYLCSMTVHPNIERGFQGVEYDAPFVHKLFSAGRLQLGVCSYSWKYSARGPDIGLYMPSTKRDIVITERDFLNVPGTDEPSSSMLDVRSKLLDDMILGVNAPRPHIVPKLIFAEDQLQNPPEHTLLVQTNFKYSCMRYPYGMLHRSQMSPAAAEELYGPHEQGVMGTIESQSLQGYCEKIYSGKVELSQYRHCPNARHTPQERKDFCSGKSTTFLANHMLFGYHASDVTAASSCDDTLRVCLIVPGSAFLAGDIKTYTTQGSGSGGPGYTLLVAPFNATFLRRFIIEPRALPMYASREQPYKMPDYTSAEHLTSVTTDQMEDTYGYDPEDVRDMLYLGADVAMTLEHNGVTTKSAAIAFIAKTVTNFVDSIFADSHNNDGGNANLCSFVPDHTGDETSVKVCVRPSDVLLPISEVMIPIEYDGILLQSAYQPIHPADTVDRALFTADQWKHHVYPVLFQGIPDGATTCERIISGSNAFTLHASFGHTPECNGFDAYMQTPVKLTGISTADSVIYVDVRDYDTVVAVAILGSDFEMFNVPSELEVSNTFVSVVRNQKGDTNYDMALARVVHPSDAGFDLTVSCMYGNADYDVDETDDMHYVMKALARYDKPQRIGCRLLEMGAMHKPITVHPVHAATGKWETRPANNPMTEYNEECIEGLPWHEGTKRNSDLCYYVNVSMFTGIFGIGVDEFIVEAPSHHSTTLTILTVMLAIYTTGLVFLNIALWYDNSRETLVDAGIVDADKPGAQLDPSEVKPDPTELSKDASTTIAKDAENPRSNT